MKRFCLKKTAQIEVENEKRNLETGEQACWPDLPGLWRRLSKEFRLAFLSTMGIGFIVHLFVFSNLLINHDGVVSLISKNSNLTSGRWSLSLFSSFSGLYETPVVIALLTIFAIAWAAGLTVRALELKNPACIVLCAGFLVSFPSICCIFPYLYTADAYFFALLLNAAGVYVMKRYRFGWAAAMVFLAVSVGIYQSFICYAVGLLLFDCMLGLFFHTSTKEIFRRGGLALLTIGGALVLYRLILQVCLWLQGTALSGYRGMDKAVNSGILDYLRAVPQTYYEFVRFFWRPAFLSTGVRMVHLLLLALGVGGGIFLIISHRLYQRPLRLCLLLLGVSLMPAALNLICIIAAGNTQTNLLMHYAFVLVYVFLLKIFELCIHQLAPCGNGFWKLPGAAALCLCGILVWSNFCVTNTAYLRVQLVYENSYALANRLMCQLEMMDGYTTSTPVVLVGSAKDTFGNKVRFAGLEEFSGMNTSLVSEYCGTTFINAFLGCDKWRISPEQRQELLDSGFANTMPLYPAEGSIQWHNGMIVIHLGNYSDLSVFMG